MSKKRIATQSLPNAVVSKDVALEETIRVLHWALYSERVDISGPESDVAFRRLQICLAMCKVALNPESERIGHGTDD